MKKNYIYMLKYINQISQIKFQHTSIHLFYDIRYLLLKQE